MMLLQSLRDRIGGAFAAIIGAVLFFACGAVLAFVISPQQAAEWRRIQNLPETTAASFEAADVNEEIAATGRLEGNATVTDDSLVAYIREEWDVDPPDDNDNTADGSWRTIETVSPPLTLSLPDGTIQIEQGSSLTMGGAQHETITRGTGISARYEGQDLPEGSTRVRGYKNGDLLTVVGHKSSAGSLVPDRLFGGDRVQLVENVRSGARVAFAIGVGLMICSPLMLIGGVLGALLGRRRGGGSGDFFVGKKIKLGG